MRGPSRPPAACNRAPAAVLPGALPDALHAAALRLHRVPVLGAVHVELALLAVVAWKERRQGGAGGVLGDAMRCLGVREL